MKTLLILCLLALFSNSVASSEYQSIISNFFTDLKVLEKTDFDMETINSQLPPEKLKKFNGIFSLAIKDYDGNNLTDFVALTYNKNIKPKLIRSHYYREYSLVLCLQNKEYSCKIIKTFERSYPSQYYLSSANLYNNLQCENESFKKGMPAFYLEPALGNIWEWGVYHLGKVVICSAGD